MSKQTPIAFLVRATPSDGIGHLVRSLAVAKEIAGHRPVQIFKLGGSTGDHLVGATGIDFHHCADDSVAAEQIKKLAPEVVVFDMLTFDAEAFESIREQCVTVSLSPVFSCLSLTDHLYHRTKIDDPRWDRGSGFPKVHKGLQYTILPGRLKRVPSALYYEHCNESKLAIAISMGGSDASNRTLKLLEKFGSSSRDFVIYVAIGEAYKHSYEDLLRSADRNRQEIILLKSNESMWRILQGTSVVVCAGGLTTYEAAYVGIPSINLPQQPGWGYLFEELTEARVSITVDPGPEDLESAIRIIEGLDQDRTQLVRMHDATHNLLSSVGARRVARDICKLNTKPTTSI